MGLCDRATRPFDFGLGGLEIAAVENNQCRAIARRRSQIRLEETAVQAAIGKSRILRSEIFKGPSKNLRKKIFGRLEIFGGKIPT